MNAPHDPLAAFLDSLITLPGFQLITPLSPQSRTGLGETPLHVAAIRGDTEAIAALVGAGAEIDAPGEHGYTPLHEAVEQGHGPAVSLLLCRGASAAIANDEGYTPEQLAQLLGAHEITRLFHGQPI